MANFYENPNCLNDVNLSKRYKTFYKNRWMPVAINLNANQLSSFEINLKPADSSVIAIKDINGKTNSWSVQN